MTDCVKSGESFVNFVFTPTIAVLSTKDVDNFLAPNNLSFTELISPFTENLKDVYMKDGNNIVHVVKKLSIRFENVIEPYDPIMDREFLVQPSQFPMDNPTSFSLNGRDINIPFEAPWFETWRHLFIARLCRYEHEFLTRYLGCIFVVSTRNPDPLGAFAHLVQQQVQIANAQPNRWFSQSNFVKFFVLVNDSDMMSSADSNKVFQLIRATYGNMNCYFLNLAPAPHNVGSNNPANDIWLPYLLPQGWNPAKVNGNSSVLKPKITSAHGENLPLHEHDKIRALVEDFVLRILVPWTETTIKNLNEQTSHRLRKTRGFFSATRKLFSQTSLNDASSSSLTSSQSDSVISLLDGSSELAYPDDSMEQQMRRLADLLFLFQQYESAHQIYDLLKKDFKQKSAWLHYAGTQEMSALSTYLQGTVSQRQYPQHQMDDSIITYVTKCKNPDLALRAVLLHTEALKSRELFAEMAVCFIRFADIDGFLTGGLLLEQAAYCSLRGKRPFLRHFAMRLALAGVRFARAKQPHLSARSFALALEILSPSKKFDVGWTLALDHVNENLARQQLLLNRPKEALESLWHLLSPRSSQLESVQVRFLREFLTILNQVKSSGDGGSECPVLSLPVFDIRHIKVMLGAPVRKTDDCPIAARGIAFSDDEHDDAEDLRIFTTQQAALPHHFTSKVFPTLVSPTDIPAWMVAKDSSTLETWKYDSSERMKRPGEDFIRHLYARPSYPLPRQAIFRRLRSLIHLQSGQELPREMTDSCLVTWTSNTLTGQKSRKSVHWHCIPVGEQLTVQIPLHNPWKVPLVLTDLQLLWQAKLKPDESSEAETLMTNENASAEKLREAKNYVQTSVTSEFYILPGERKVVELALQPRRCVGDLLVTGVNFKLDVKSPCPSSLSDLPSPIAPSLTSINASLELLSLTPQLDVSVSASDSLRDPLTSSDTAGENLSGTEPDYASSAQGKVLFSTSVLTDPRFHWTVIQPRALLKAYFGGFPQSLFEGEIYSHTLTLFNAGSSALNALQVATSWPSFFILSNTTPSLVASLIPNGPLEAGQSRVEQFWIRAPTALMGKISRPERENGPLITHTLAASIRHLHLVFGYSALTDPSSLRYLQHEASVQLLPSMQFSANCARTQGSGVDSLIVTVRCKNVSPQHTFSMFQLASLDKNWDMCLISPKDVASTQDGLLVQPGREITLCIRAARRKSTLQALDLGAGPSRVVLDAAFAKIDPLAAPYSQFFRLVAQAAQIAAVKNEVAQSMPEAPETDLQPKDFCLLVLWRYVDMASLDNSTTGNQRIGQSHIRVVYAHTPKALQSPSGNNLARMLASIPSLLPISSLLRLRLHHPSRVVHNFTHDDGHELIPGLSSGVKSSAMAIIPVIAEIYNASSCPVTARLSTNEDSGNRNQAVPQTGGNSRTSVSEPPRVLWTGASVQQISLEPGQIRNLTLSARVASPGVYEVNSLCLKASTQPTSPVLPIPSRPYGNDGGIGNENANRSEIVAKEGISNTTAPFVRQLCDFSSLVFVVAAT